MRVQVGLLHTRRQTHRLLLPPLLLLLLPISALLQEELDRVREVA